MEIVPAPDDPAAEPVIRYMTNDQALEAYRSTLPQHEEMYRELAKGPSSA